MEVDDPGGGRTFGSYFGILGDTTIKNTKKRRKMRGERININFNESEKTEEVFMVVESDTKGKSLANYNPFLFAKATEMAIGGKPLQTTILRDGKMLMRMRNHKEAKKLYNINLNHGDNCIKVKVYEHKTLNTSKGVIRCDACKFLTEQELLEGLQPQNVTEVYIMKRRGQNGEMYNTRTAILTFKTTVLPRKVDIGYFSERVELFIPNPMRCMKCMRFGHTKKYCSREKTCAKCGDLYHEVCNNPLKCTACGENHSSLDKECPIWKDEVEIKKIQTEKRITIREARRIRREVAPIVPRNYTTINYSKILSDNTSKPITTEKRRLDVTIEEDNNAKKINENNRLNIQNKTTHTDETEEITDELNKNLNQNTQKVNEINTEHNDTLIYLSDTDIQRTEETGREISP